MLAEPCLQAIDATASCGWRRWCKSISKIMTNAVPTTTHDHATTSSQNSPTTTQMRTHMDGSGKIHRVKGMAPQHRHVTQKQKQQKNTQAPTPVGGRLCNNTLPASQRSTLAHKPPTMITNATSNIQPLSQCLAQQLPGTCSLKCTSAN